MQVRETSGAKSGTGVAAGEADRPRPRVRAPRETAGRRVAISGTSGRQRPTAKQHGSLEAGALLQRAPTPTGDSPMLRHQVAAETSPGAWAQVAVGEGLRSGHGPVAEFLVGAAASSTARIHRVPSSFRALRKEPHPGRELLRARGSLSDAHRCIPGARFDNPSRRSPPALDCTWML